ncbi:hypothetical protein ACWX0P_17820 [Vibrio mediterranei]
MLYKIRDGKTLFGAALGVVLFFYSNFILGDVQHTLGLFSCEQKEKGLVLTIYSAEEKTHEVTTNTNSRIHVKQSGGCTRYTYDSSLLPLIILNQETLLEWRVDSNCNISTIDRG